MRQPDGKPGFGVVNVLIGSVILVTPAGQFLRVGDTGMYLLDPLLAVCTMLLIARYRMSPFRSLKMQLFARATALFLIWNGITFLAGIPLVPFERNIIAAAYLIRLTVYLVFAVYVCFHCLRGEIRRRYLDRAILLSGILIMTGGFVQYFLYPDLRPFLMYGWDPHYARLFGTYLEPVVFAALSGLFMIGLAHISSRLRFVLLPVAAAAILATFSRGAWAALFGAAVASVPQKIRIPAMAGILLFGVAGILLLPKPSGEGVNLFRTSTIVSREADYRQGVELWRQFPLTGVGYNRIGAYKQVASAPGAVRNNAASSFHTSYLVILATSGLLGLLLYLNLLIASARLHKAACASLLFLGILSLFDNVLLHPFVMLSFAVSTGRFLIPPVYR